MWQTKYFRGIEEQSARFAYSRLILSAQQISVGLRLALRTSLYRLVPENLGHVPRRAEIVDPEKNLRAGGRDEAICSVFAIKGAHPAQILKDEHEVRVFPQITNAPFKSIETAEGLAFIKQDKRLGLRPGQPFAAHQRRHCAAHDDA